MIVQTKRAPGKFATVLRGELVKVGDATPIEGCYWLLGRGSKKETGEPYEFRLVLTKVEVQQLARISEAWL